MRQTDDQRTDSFRARVREPARVAESLAGGGVNAVIDHPGTARLDGRRHQETRLTRIGTGSGRR